METGCDIMCYPEIIAVCASMRFTKLVSSESGVFLKMPFWWNALNHKLLSFLGNTWRHMLLKVTVLQLINRFVVQPLYSTNAYFTKTVQITAPTYIYTLKDIYCIYVGAIPFSVKIPSQKRFSQFWGNKNWLNIRIAQHIDRLIEEQLL